MSRKKTRVWATTLKRLTASVMLFLCLFAISTGAFVLTYRNELLIVAAQLRSASAIQGLTALGASSAVVPDGFPESALIAYLLQLEGKPEQSTEVASALIRSGSTVRERSAKGWTPLMFTAVQGQLRLLDFFLQNGAEIEARVVGNEQTEGLTPLMMAAMNGQTAATQKLLERGANVHARSRSGFSALLLAVTRGHLGCVDILIEAGASIPASTVQVAEQSGHTEVANRLRTALSASRDSLTRRPSHYPEE